MHRIVSFRLLLAASLLSATTALAQQPAPADPVDARQIHLDVVVTPKSGSPVAEVQQHDFTVLDNNAAVPLTAFKAISETGEPIAVVIAIDAINTTAVNIAYERQQISKFLRANGGHLDYPTSLAILTDTGDRMQRGGSTDGNALDKSLSDQTIGLRDLRRSSGIYGADDRLQLSLKAMRQLAAYEATQPGRKIVLWVSPGWPILSGPGIELSSSQEQSIFNAVVDMSSALRGARITLYALDSLGVNESLLRSTYYEEFLKGVRKPGDAVLGNLSLQVLATQSGGMALNSSDLAGSMRKSLDDTKVYYELSFEQMPAERKDEYHQIDVKVAKPGLIARTRTGYYAEPQATNR